MAALFHQEKLDHAVCHRFLLAEVKIDQRQPAPVREAGCRQTCNNSRGRYSRLQTNYGPTATCAPTNTLSPSWH
jgi:hypothetical protein